MSSVLISAALFFAAARLTSGLGADIRNSIAAAAAREQKSDVDVYYLNRVADEFTAFAGSHSRILDAFHQAEQDRLEVAIRDSSTGEGKSVLEDSAAFNEESRLEARNAFNEMTNFVTTLKQAMGAQGNARSCDQLTCGRNALCTAEGNSARCRCDAGYEGNGFVCNTPQTFEPQALVQLNITEPFPQVADLHVSTLSHNRLAVVFRDTARENKGFLMLGRAQPDKVAWSRPVVFSEGSEAFSPVVTELYETDDASGPLHLAIAYRDENRGGNGVLLGAMYDVQTGKVSFTETRLFARFLAQGMSMVALPGSRVAVLFAEHSLAGHASVSVEASGQAGVPPSAHRHHSSMYGAALIARVTTPGQGAPEVIAKQRFVTGAVARLSSALISPTSFVVAYRHASEGAETKRGEASCVHAQLHGSELVFEQQAVLLEPERGQIWSQNVAPLGGGAVAYTYHSGSEQLTKQAILRVDPLTHRLHIVRGPEVLARGFSPFVGAVTTSLAQQSPSHASRPAKSFTYFSKEGSTNAAARICGSYSPDSGAAPQCKELSWATRQLSSVSGTPVGDGRIIFAYADHRGVPYYQLVGMEGSLAAEM